MIESGSLRPRGGTRSVAELVREVGETLANRFGAVTVRGEISGHARAASGHCYFSLKDADGGSATLRCAMFRRAAILLDFAPADGQLVEVRGRIDVYEPRGELQFIVEAMRRAGDGALFERFLRLKAQLEAQGLFDPARKRPLPAFARRIGVVTSLGGAALHDVQSTLARRAPQVQVIVYPSPVQGAEAPPALCAAIELASRRAEVETLIVCRGGGSLEDLWAFNDERVVRAIAAASIPVVCGVGHETDITLADLAADLRAPTPTAAAELAAPVRADCLAQLETIATALRTRLHRVLDDHGQWLDRAAMRLLRPSQGVLQQAHRLELLGRRLHNGVTRPLEQGRAGLPRLDGHLRRAAALSLALQRQRLDGLAGRLRSLDPAQVLQRGYAWITDESGRAIVSVHAMRVGSHLRAVLADGVAGVTVDELAPSGIERLQRQPE
ncbi:MAG TPA: exodeoxyribonuclease VII large subunit [Burkholderiaceae bacterium]